MENTRLKHRQDERQPKTIALCEADFRAPGAEETF
jgi:hypothetical protein